MAIQITEYSYSSANGEFVEFTNTGTSPVDITGWSFDDNSRIAGSFLLTGFGTVKAGESVIITETVDVNAFRTAWGLASTVKVLGGSNIAKVTGGSDQALQRADELNLYDASGTLVDRLTYDDATITGSPRTQNISANIEPANLGKNDAAKSKLSAVGDTQGSKTSVTGGDIGNPGSYLTVAAPVTLAGIDLSKYTRVGRYDLPEPTRTTPPTGSLLAQEVSGVTYDWDTDTLFVVGDGGTSVVQVDKKGKLIDSMTLTKGASPQGTEFYDPEGIAYVGGGKFVMTEERDRQIVSFTYAKDTTLTRTTAGTSTVKLGTTIGNIGLEGITYDPRTNGYVLVKEATPEGIFQTTIDFAAKTASNGSPTTVNSIDLFDPNSLGLLDLADVYSLSNVTALNGTADSSHLLVLSQESGKIVNVDRTGKIFSTLTITGDAGDTLTVPNQSHEGVTVDKNGILYVTSENGGGDVDHPQLWVYAPSAVTTPAVNQAPTAVLLGNLVNAIADKTSTAARVKVADITVTDDGLGTNNLTLTGTDASLFEIFNNGLYVKAGTAIDFKTKPSYNVSVNVDDPTVGATPDAVKSFVLNVTDPNAIPTTGSIFVTEVAPWSSGNSPIGADWFELTNTSKAAVNITGWKFDDNSNSFASALTLDGITSIGAGESVVFVEVSTVTGAIDAFKKNWFGTNVPAGFKIGSYSGAGAGLSTAGDAVNIYNAVGDLQANVVFGVSPAATPFASFNNAALLNNDTISTLSAAGVNGAVSIVDSLSNTEIGSPGSIGTVAAPVNKAPTAVLLTNLVDRLAENSSNTARVRVADITVTDDGLGTNTLSLAGADASAFEIFNNALYVKAGTNLDYETKNSYSVSVNVDDITVGATPDATKTFILSLTDVVEPTLFSAVAAGDATTNDVILWTRTYDATSKKAVNTNSIAEVSTDAGFSKIASTYKVPARTDGLDHDGTLKIDATGLTSGTKYYYRFKTDAGDISQIGTFKTALAADVKAAVRFGFSGDYDGLMRPYSSTADFAKLNLDFFGNVGDTIYETASKFSPAAADPTVNAAQALIDYHGKYLENLQPTTPGGFASLQTLFASQGNYTQLDNHELGNKQIINGGAPAILAPNPGNGTNKTEYDVNKTGTFINQTVAFKTLAQAYTDYQPIKEKIVVALGDARSNGTQQLYNSQQWGTNVLYVNTDTRSYRDVRLKTTDAAGNITTTDDTGARADNADRTLLGKTQLAWVKQNLIDAQKNGVTWKFVAVSDPIDQLGAIGSGSDNGKSWIGGYRAERNELLKYIADNGIKNVVFLSCDDHQNRINELTYLDNINDPTSIRVLPNAISVVDGPIGATGPDTVTDHTFANIKALADKLAATQTAAGVNPIGLAANFAGLRNVIREGDPNADTLRQAIDFYSPDTFNYTTFDISADGKTLNVNVQGINSYAKDTNPEPSATNPVRSILSFNLDAAVDPTVVAGTAGDDTKIVPTRLDIIFTDGGNDLVDASVAKGDNRIYGGDGNDELLAGKNDRLFGEASDDTLDATAGKGGNRLYGGAGNDLLFAGTNDFLSGGDGTDILYAGKGGNTLYGGAGADKFYLAYNGAPTSTNTVADFEVGIDKLLILGITGATDFSKVTLTAKGTDTLVAAGGKDLAVLTGIQSSTLNAGSFSFV